MNNTVFNRDLLNRGSKLLFPELYEALEAPPPGNIAIINPEVVKLLPSQVEEVLSTSSNILAWCDIIGFALIFTPPPLNLVGAGLLVVGANPVSLGIIATDAGVSIYDKSRQLYANAIKEGRLPSFGDSFDLALTTASAFAVVKAANSAVTAGLSAAQLAGVMFRARRTLLQARNALKSARTVSHAIARHTVLKWVVTIMETLLPLTPTQAKSVSAFMELSSSLRKIARAASDVLKPSDQQSMEWLESASLTALTTHLASYDIHGNNDLLTRSFSGLRQLPSKQERDFQLDARLRALHEDASKFLDAHAPLLARRSELRNDIDCIAIFAKCDLMRAAVNASEGIANFRSQLADRLNYTTTLMPAEPTPFDGDVAEGLMDLVLEARLSPRSTSVGSPVFDHAAERSIFAPVVAGTALRLLVLREMGLLSEFHLKALSASDPLEAALRLSECPQVNSYLLPWEAAVCFNPFPRVTSEGITRLTTDKVRTALMSFELRDEETGAVGMKTIGSHVFRLNQVLGQRSFLPTLLNPTDDFDIAVLRWIFAFGLMADAMPDVLQELTASEQKKETKDQDSNLLLALSASKFTAEYAPLEPVQQRIYKLSPDRFVLNKSDAKEALTITLPRTVDVSAIGVPGFTGQKSLNDILAKATSLLRQTNTLSLATPYLQASTIRLEVLDREAGPDSALTSTFKVNSIHSLSQNESRQPPNVSLQSVERYPFTALILAQALCAVPYSANTFPGLSLGTELANTIVVDPSTGLRSLRMYCPGISTVAGRSMVVPAFIFMPNTLLVQATTIAGLAAFQRAYEPTIMGYIRQKVRNQKENDSDSALEEPL